MNVYELTVVCKTKKETHSILLIEEKYICYQYSKLIFDILHKLLSKNSLTNSTRLFGRVSIIQRFIYLKSVFT